MPNPPTYPRLIDLLPERLIPEGLDKIDGVLDQILKEIHYKNFTFFVSKRGDAGSYSLTLILDQELGVGIGATDGLRLLLCPGANTSTTEIDVLFNYRIDALRYTNLIDIKNFDAQPLSYVKAVMLMMGIRPVDLFKSIVSEYEGENVETFIAGFNSQNPSHSLILNTGFSADNYEDVLFQLVDPAGNNLDAIQYFFDRYMIAGSLNETFGRIKLVFKKWLADASIEDFLNLFIPKFSFSIEDIDLAVEFPRSIFIPLQDGSYVTTPPTPIGSPLPEPFKARLSFNAGSLVYTSNNGFFFDNENAFNFSRAQIGNTGFTIELNDIKLDLSRRKNIPEATADGRPDDFIGAYVLDGSIGFPTSWGHNPSNAQVNPSTAELFVSNLLAGTGGISGTIGMRASVQNSPSALLRGTFGQSIRWELNTFEVEFQQNSIISSGIEGRLIIPGFTDTNGGDAILDIDIHFASNGDFYVTSKALSTAPTWQIANVLRISVSSAYTGRINNRFYIGVSGKIDFIANIPALGDVLPKGVEIKKLIIWEDGSIEIEGGNIILPNAVTLKIGPVKLSITAISMGSYEKGARKYRYFGFDGGVNVSPGGVDARANGVKFYYSVDGGPLDMFVRIEGIAIDLIIPGNAKPEDAAVILSGFLSMKEPTGSNSNAGTEYAGSVSFSLPKAHITGSAGMRMQPNWPAFLIDASMELATPIPLGSTGLSIYGFRGLIGGRYVASKLTSDLSNKGVTEESSWYEYYKAKTPTEGININKFEAKPGFSLGAGVSLATGADQGKSFSSKLFLLLSLPDVMLLQGQGAILRERVGLDTINDPPFSALIAITKHSVEAAFGVNAKFPEESGKIAVVDGLIEMGFFFGNNSAWYVNVGRDLPAEKRVRARILNLFDSYFYLMLSSGGMKAGAGASWQFSKSFLNGKVGLEAGAYIDLAGRISIKPKQIGGSIQLGGYARLKVYKFQLGFSVTASLAAEAPKPFIVTGSVCVAVDLPKPLKDLEVCLDFTWVFDSTLNLDPQPVIDTSNVSEKPPATALSMVTNETFSILHHNDTGTLPSVLPNLDGYVIPMDSYIDVEFTKPVLPDLNSPSVSLFGGFTTGAEYTEMIPPQRGKSDQVQHAYEVKNIEIKAWDGNGWVDYDVYHYVDTNDPLFSQLPPNSLAQLKYGYWQKDSANKYNKLRILAQNPLSFLTQGTGNLNPEELGITGNTIFCAEDPIKQTCVDFDFEAVGQNISLLAPGQLLAYRGVSLNNSSGFGYVHAQAGFTHQLALSVPSLNELEIILPERSVTACLKLSGADNALSIQYYRREKTATNDSSNMPVFAYNLVSSQPVAFQSLPLTICYNDPNEPIDRIVIVNGCDPKNFEEPMNCGTTVSAEGLAIADFLNSLANASQLTTDFNLSPVYSGYYSGVFIGSLLYNPTYSYTNIDYTVEIFSPDLLQVNIADDVNYSCSFRMEVMAYDNGFDWSAVSQFDNIRVYESALTDGPNYSFLIDALVNGNYYILKCSSTNYEITRCFSVCTAWLHEICYLPVTDYNYNETIPNQTQITAENTSMLNGLAHITPPVWRPDTVYAIRIETKDTISNVSNAPAPTTVSPVFLFKTDGPVGYFHQQRNEYQILNTSDQGEQFRLSTLKPYIDYNTSYPNADGNILNAKPLFYKQPRLDLYYKHAHVYTLLHDWGTMNGAFSGQIHQKVDVVIKDPAEALSSPAAITAEFATNKGIQPLDIQALNNMIENGAPCSGITGPLEVNGIHNVVQMPENLLAPLKLYTAIYYVNKQSDTTPSRSEEVHRYPFQTSRYADFTEQIQSYVLSFEPSNQRKAQFELNLDFTAQQISDMQAVMMGTDLLTDSRLIQFADPMDRILNGILNLSQLDPAQTTEFNIIRNRTQRGACIAILVRNPEPFNDPKLPVYELNSAVELSINGGPSNVYHKLYSKDRSIILFTPTASSVSTGNAVFTFRYKLYNGSTYQVESTETATITIA